MPKIKNIIIFITIGVIMVLIYIFFIKKSPEDAATLVSSSNLEVSDTGNTLQAGGDSSLITQEFLNLLLNVRNIKLDDTIFSDDAFTSLNDSSITLIPDGDEGRVNPFAPIGTDIVIPQ